MSFRKFARKFDWVGAPATRKVAFGVAAASLFAIVAVQAQTPPAPAGSESAWSKVCDVNPQTNQPICVVRTEVRSDTGMLITQVTLTKVDNADRYRLVAFLPLGVRLPPGMGIRIDNVAATPATAPFSICIPNPAVCVAETEVQPAFIDQLKRGGEVAFVATNPQGTEMPIRVSLSGFTRIFDGQGINAAQAQTQMEELNAALQRSAEAARQRLIDQQNTVAPIPAPAAP